VADHETPAGRQGPAPARRPLSERVPAAGEAQVWSVALPERDGRPRARRALREILAAYLGGGGAPEAVEFELAEEGKPQLPAPAPLCFNLSHTDGLALVAVTAPGVEVGVDVELVAPRRDPLRVARRWLPAADARRVEAATEGPERDAVFFAAWVAYEARTKCTGGGISGAPPGPEVGAWPLAAPPGYAAAIALAGREPRVTLREFGG
jgi:4'-phosphopantetheinyl transferase